MKAQLLKKQKCFEGEVQYFSHASDKTKTEMKFSTFIPEAKKIDSAIIWLSGLTCNEDNFITKAGAQKYLQSSSTMIVCPDTSPRGLDLPGEHESYDFGSGAGFYVNATTDGYKEHYNMYDYIVEELVGLIRSQFGIEKFSISGHSMGGHGALVLGLRERDIFRSVSAFSPIVNPMNCAWGKKAFAGYLGDNAELAKTYDATELVKCGTTRKDRLLIDQGLEDEFLAEQLLTENLVGAAKERGQELVVNYRAGYDHSYYFISTFVGDHIEFHLEALNSI